MPAALLAVCLLVTTPVLVHSASIWHEQSKIDVEDREQRERFFDQLAARQSARGERDRKAFESDERSSRVQAQ
jgi:hypothetical protein